VTRDGDHTIVLTFDNLGEASELERGTWDPGAPPGSHPSVTTALPRLLDALDEHGLRATFFVEAINCELNPAAVNEIAARGHELGAHGWRHEPWASLDDGRERALTQRCADAFARLGLGVTGFRPPGGDTTSRTAGHLRKAGLRWCSALGGAPGVHDGLAWLPFDWELVDAYHLMDSFGELRAERGDGTSPRAPAEVGARLRQDLQTPEGVQTVILHPFLMLDDAWWAQVQEILALVAGLAGQRKTRALPGGELAADLLGAAR
jgi:peptidoglycan/xylan/chitin deacetylase (PgdA/CDA1 family)